MTELDKKFNNILLNKINGNTADYKNQIKRLKKTTLIQFLIFLNDNPTGDTSNNPKLNEILEILLKH